METPCFAQRVMTAVQLLLLLLATRGAQSVPSEIDHDREASGGSGGDALLRCVYNGSNTANQIEWAKETNEGRVDIAIRQNNKIHVTDVKLQGRLTFLGQGNNDATILIRALRASDSGTYICRFITGRGPHEAKINLFVVGAQIDHDREASGESGGEALLRCVCKGSKTASVISWAKETNQGRVDIAIRQNDTIHVTDVKLQGRLTFLGQGNNDATILIRALRASDNGTYICRFITETGRHQAKINLLVVGGIEPGVIAAAIVLPLMALVAVVGAIYFFRKKGSPVTNRMQHLDERQMNSTETVGGLIRSSASTNTVNITRSDEKSPPDQEASHYEPLKPPAENAYDELNHPTYTSASN